MASSKKKLWMPALGAVSTLFALMVLSGCGFPSEAALDTVVYFDNKTDQTLYVRSRSEPQVKDAYSHVDLLKITQLRLVDRGKCTDRLVITDIDGKLVKDPGQVCWHGTVTIP